METYLLTVKQEQSTHGAGEVDSCVVYVCECKLLGRNFGEE